MYPELGVQTASTKEWSNAAGGIELDYPFAKEMLFQAVLKDTNESSDASNGGKKETEGLQDETPVQKSRNRRSSM